MLGIPRVLKPVGGRDRICSGIAFNFAFRVCRVYLVRIKDALPTDALVKNKPQAHPDKISYCSNSPWSPCIQKTQSEPQLQRAAPKGISKGNYCADIMDAVFHTMLYLQGGSFNWPPLNFLCTGSHANLAQNFSKCQQL